MAIIAFDLNGTLLDPSALADPLGGTEDDRRLVLAGLDAAVGQAMALSLLDRYRSFTELVQAGIARELEREGRDASLAEQAVQRTQEMRPFPGALQALDLLADAGHRLAVVTNSATESAEKTLSQAGIRERFEVVMGTDVVEAFKPDGRVYRALEERLGARPADMWLVAAHWWDVLGAGGAGWRTAWVARKEQVLLSTVEADATGADLVEAARAITAH